MFSRLTRFMIPLGSCGYLVPGIEERPPTESKIVRWKPELTYDLVNFPEYKYRGPPPTTSPPSKGEKELSEENRAILVKHWTPGQRHYMALAVAGFLRKNLHYDVGAAIQEIENINVLAGNAARSDITRAVIDTYRKSLSEVSGYAKLTELGVTLRKPKRQSDGFEVSFGESPSRGGAMEVIDFSTAPPKQEFWLKGLVGPGMIAIWAAEPKTGKSFAVMQLGYALASRNGIWSLECLSPRPLRVLYFQGELSQGMVRERAEGCSGQAFLYVILHDLL